MVSVTYEVDAADQVQSLPASIQARVAKIVLRLTQWPNVSGAKPLRAKLAGRFRMRTGDYRVQFRVEGDEVIIERVAHRDGFYED